MFCHVWSWQEDLWVIHEGVELGLGCSPVAPNSTTAWIIMTWMSVNLHSQIYGLTYLACCHTNADQDQWSKMYDLCMRSALTVLKEGVKHVWTWWKRVDTVVREDLCCTKVMLKTCLGNSRKFVTKLWISTLINLPAHICCWIRPGRLCMDGLSLA